jgi:hypothetical protein
MLPYRLECMLNEKMAIMKIGHLIENYNMEAPKEINITRILLKQKGQWTQIISLKKDRNWSWSIYDIRIVSKWDRMLDMLTWERRWRDMPQTDQEFRGTPRSPSQRMELSANSKLQHESKYETKYEYSIKAGMPWTTPTDSMVAHHKM